MAVPLNLPQLQPFQPIVDPKTGGASQYFSDYIARLTLALQNAIATNAGLITALQIQQQQVLAQQSAIQQVAGGTATAQGTADTGSTARSGDALATVDVGGALVVGPQVNLVGVSAGALTIVGTMVYQGPATQVSPGDNIGNFRIVEIIAGVPAQIYAGTYQASGFYTDETGFVSYLYMISDPSTFSSARVSTGAVSYRMDLNLPGGSATDVQAYLSVRRA